MITITFQLSTQAELSCLAKGQGTMYSKKGAMIAYQGKFKFEKVLIDPNSGSLVKGAINRVIRGVTGENMELMKVSGQGDCYFADEAQHITVIDLEPNDSLSVESENLLAFNDTCNYGVKFVGVGVVSQKGLFTSKLTAKGSGAQAAVKTDGNPLILQTPCIVDPDAVVCWSGPDPKFKVDVNWKTLIGQTSGESYMLNFKQEGYVVIVQPSERLSGLNIGIDDDRYAPNSQNSAAQGSMNNLREMGQQFGNVTGRNNNSQGNNGGIVGNIMNNFLGE